MKTQPTVVFRPFLRIVLFALICIGSSAAHAENLLPPRFRGPIVSVNLEEKVLTVNTMRGEVTATWDNQSDIRSSANIRTFKQLKPGMFVRIDMQEDRKTIRRVRHQPQNDIPVEKEATYR